MARLAKQPFGAGLGKIIPDQEDYEAIERKHGRLPYNATPAEISHRNRLAQTFKILREAAAAEAKENRAPPRATPPRRT